MANLVLVLPRSMASSMSGGGVEGQHVAGEDPADAIAGIEQQPALVGQAAIGAFEELGAGMDSDAVAVLRSAFEPGGTHRGEPFDAPVQQPVEEAPGQGLEQLGHRYLR